MDEQFKINFCAPKLRVEFSLGGGMAIFQLASLPILATRAACRLIKHTLTNGRYYQLNHLRCTKNFFSMVVFIQDYNANLGISHDQNGFSYY